MDAPEILLTVFRDRDDSFGGFTTGALMRGTSTVGRFATGVLIVGRLIVGAVIVGRGLDTAFLTAASLAETFSFAFVFFLSNVFVFVFPGACLFLSVGNKRWLAVPPFAVGTAVCGSCTSAASATSGAISSIGTSTSAWASVSWRFWGLNNARTSPPIPPALGVLANTFELSCSPYAR